MIPIAGSEFRCALLAAALAIAIAAPATAAPFAYRGSLSDRGAPAEGAYGFRLTFYDAQFGGKALAPETTLDGVAVHGGTFDASIDLDPNVQARDTLWLQVEVRGADGTFVPLADREAVQPKALAAGVCWDTQGNVGTNATTDFLGTTDLQALNLRAGNVRALRLEPGVGAIPNVVGGASNTTLTLGVAGIAIGGGSLHKATDDGGTIAGGIANTAGDGTGDVTTAEYATVGGGIDNSAKGARSVVAGGGANAATGDYATSPGGQFNCAGGYYSFAAGFAAKVRPGDVEGSGPCEGVPNTGDLGGDAGTFVWNDASASSFTSTGPNQFLVRATGGVGINTNTPAVTGSRVSLYVKGFDTTAGTVTFQSPKGTGAILSHVHYGTGGDWFIRSAVNTGKVVIQDTGGTVSIGTSAVVAGQLIETGAAGAHLTTGGTWVNGSSRLLKEAFADIDAGAILDKVLALPIGTWQYRNSPEGTHLGPMAEDFSAAFGLGDGDKHIATVDADGVALAAIQGLNEKLERENAALRERLDRLERSLGRTSTTLGEDP